MSSPVEQASLHGRAVGLLVLIGLITCVFGSTAAEETKTTNRWRYVVPADEPQIPYPVSRAILVSDEKPEDFLERVEYRGTRRRYAQLRYGSRDSVRVTLVVDELPSGEADLYVDTRRTRSIAARDRVEGKGDRWQFPLDVAIVGDDTVVETHRREVLVQRGAAGRVLAVATLGWMQGTVSLGDRRVTARRVDGNADGYFAGLEDRLWIDRNGDGTWDPFTEQFLFAPTLRVGSERYALRSDELGHRLAMERLEGTGTVRLTLNHEDSKTPGIEMAAMLIGRDGTAVPVSGLGRPVEVPIGEYRLNTLFIILPAGDGGRRWCYLFSKDRQREAVWYEVAKGETLALDPLGTLELTIEIEGNPAACKPGERLTIFPLLHTRDGLLINTCYRGSEHTQANQPKATVSLKSPNGIEFDSYQSGFF
jgi:hypothetical protein